MISDESRGDIERQILTVQRDINRVRRRDARVRAAQAYQRDYADYSLLKHLRFLLKTILAIIGSTRRYGDSGNRVIVQPTQFP
jgi:hypothetical protein